MSSSSITTRLGQGNAPRCVRTFLAAVADTSNQPVYIHCGSANRVAVAWNMMGVRVQRAVTAGERRRADALAEPKGAAHQLVQHRAGFMAGQRGAVERPGDVRPTRR